MGFYLACNSRLGISTPRIRLFYYLYIGLRIFRRIPKCKGLNRFVCHLCIVQCRCFRWKNDLLHSRLKHRLKLRRMIHFLWCFCGKFLSFLRSWKNRISSRFRFGENRSRSFFRLLFLGWRLFLRIYMDHSSFSKENYFFSKIWLITRLKSIWFFRKISVTMV